MISKSGPDPDFPFLSENDRFLFPDPLKVKHDSIIAWGGNLSPGMLLSAYEQGLFPWYSEDDPIVWQSPDPRFVIFNGMLHVSSSMKKILKRKIFSITFDQDFAGVISSCSRIKRSGQGGSWITSDMIAAYTELHRLGWAHSAEAYYEGELAGGCYGIRLGNIFFGESMFSKKANASKAAFITLARILFNDNIILIDCQQPTRHLESFGAEKMEKEKFIPLLGETLALRSPEKSDSLDRRGNWGEVYGVC